MSVTELSPTVVQSRIQSKAEMALLDVREYGEFGTGHPAFASLTPFSRFEPEILRLVPSLGASIVLYDDGESGRAARAASMAAALGYREIALLKGGISTWRATGFLLIQNTFKRQRTWDELLQQAWDGAIDITESNQGRYNTDCARRRNADASDEGPRLRTSSDVCLPTGGIAECWNLSLEIRQGSAVEKATGHRFCPLEVPSDKTVRHQLRALARDLAARWPIPKINQVDLLDWLRDGTRTTYLLDVRSAKEFAETRSAPILNAPITRLLSSTERWLAVLGARVVLVDDTEIRAVVAAQWLQRIGWDAHALAGGTESWPALAEVAGRLVHSFDQLRPILAADLVRLQAPPPPLFDLRTSIEFQACHIVGARLVTRWQLPQLLGLPNTNTIAILIATDGVLANLAAADLRRLGCEPRLLVGDPPDWIDAGLIVESTQTTTPHELVDTAYLVQQGRLNNLKIARRCSSIEEPMALIEEPMALSG